MKLQTPNGRRTHPPALTAFACLGLGVLLAIIIAVAAVGEFTWTRDEAVTPPSAKSSATAGRSHGFRYFRLDQWRADARTLVAVVRYVLESDVPTNPEKPAQRSLGLELAMPTNSTSVGPKA